MRVSLYQSGEILARCSEVVLISDRHRMIIKSLVKVGIVRVFVEDFLGALPRCLRRLPKVIKESRNLHLVLREQFLKLREALRCFPPLRAVRMDADQPLQFALGKKHAANEITG